jgi:hypothetical protein
VAQVVEHLICKHETLYSNPIATQKNKKKTAGLAYPTSVLIYSPP